MKPPAKRILVGIRLVEALRDVLQGIGEYVKDQQRNWQIHSVDADEFEHQLSTRQVDGAITVISPRWLKRIRKIQKSGVPTVSLLHDATPALPSVLSDDPGIGVAAAEYFLARGFQNFGFLGLDTEWSRQRESGYVAHLRSAGFAGSTRTIIFPLKDYRLLDAGRLRGALRRWMKVFPAPAAVLSCSDVAARALLLGCESAGLRVPQDISIVGVDNMISTCEMASVPLSSVPQDFRRLGHEAARVLDRRMAGKPVSSRPIILPPAPIVVRQSSDSFAFADERLSEAMRIIHQRGGDGLAMKELASMMNLSRKWLDVQFKAILGRTPSAEIRSVRFNRVRDLLLTTDLSIFEIATRCGFGCGENLIRFFRESAGVPPQQFRAKHRQSAGIQLKRAEVLSPQPHRRVESGTR